jgi:hypothetical protein
MTTTEHQWFGEETSKDQSNRCSNQEMQLVGQMTKNKEQVHQQQQQARINQTGAATKNTKTQETKTQDDK